MWLKEWKNWLKDCNYPDSVLNQSFYNAELQGPASFKDNSKNIYLVTIYYDNIDNEKWSGKFVLNYQTFSQDTFQKYLKI